MAIRLRNVNGLTVALCAAETDYQVGDTYLDDAEHHALSTKFALDWQSEGLIENPPVDSDLVAVMETQRARDAETELELWLSQQPLPTCTVPNA
jgi:hypothetical protein